MDYRCNLIKNIAIKLVPILFNSSIFLNCMLKVILTSRNTLDKAGFYHFFKCWTDNGLVTIGGSVKIPVFSTWYYAYLYCSDLNKNSFRIPPLIQVQRGSNEENC